LEETIKTNVAYSTGAKIENKSNGIVAGFVYDNTGIITNSFANTVLVTDSAYIAGFVTSTQHMTTKTGRPWSKTMIEDYNGSYELALFGKDHEAYMSYMQLHSAIFIEGEIEEKYYLKPEEKAKGKTSPYGFKVKKIMLLGNVTDTFVKGFSISISTPMLTPEFRERLVKLIKNNKGNVPLTMYLYDPEKKWNIEFLSRKFKVSVTADLIDELNAAGIKYSVIKK
jgi:DNA polymerase-3 subunit alpha